MSNGNRRRVLILLERCRMGRMFGLIQFSIHGYSLVLVVRLVEPLEILS